MNRRNVHSDSATTLPPATADTVPPRVVMLGLRCDFTRIVVEHCLRGGVDVLALLVPGPPGLAAPVEISRPVSPLPMAGSARTDGQPRLFQIAAPGSESTRELLAVLQPDVVAVACYPTRIPGRTAGLARLGAVNVHPSLLPEGRGPDPLFWTLRRGDGRAGVTIHALADRFDAGPIYAQRAIDYSGGTTESQLDAMLAEAGGWLLAETVTALATGTAVAMPQDERRASYQSWPAEEDYTIGTDGSARAAFNFIRGIAGRRYPVTIATPDEPVIVAEALRYARDGRPPGSDSDGARWIGFADGWLLIRERRTPEPG